jgi:hypothetical protein
VDPTRRYRTITKRCVISQKNANLGFLRVEDVAARPTPNLEGQRIFVRHMAQNLSGMGGPASSYAAAGIAFEFADVGKVHTLLTVPIEVEIPSDEGYICSCHLLYEFEHFVW